MNIVTRKEWGARAAKAGVDRAEWSERTGVTFHHTTGPTGQSIRGIQDFHMASRGWLDIGYNFLVRIDGTVYEGRGWTKVGAHADGHNTSDIGIAFIGDFRVGHDTFSKAARDAGAALYAEACKRAGKRLDYRGHRQWPDASTECPGGQVIGWIDAHGPEHGDQGDDGSVPEPPTRTETDRIMEELPTLKQGDRGVPVTRVQVLLNIAGASPRLIADGDFGPNTDREVKDLQRRFGVTVDGIVGTGQTWPILMGLRP